VTLLHDPNDLRDTNVRDAVRFCAVVAALGAAFLVFAALWLSTCHGATVDGVACGAPQRTLLAVGAPAILLAGGIWAFVRTYQTWRSRETWWAWQGAGMLLVTLTVLAVTMGVPAVSGSTVFGA
jgi:hypothetical protein